jgi:hypothetical protein
MHVIRVHYARILLAVAPLLPSCAHGPAALPACPPSHAVAAGCATNSAVLASERTGLPRGWRACAEGFAFSTELKRCESKRSDVWCPRKSLIRTATTLGCYGEAAESHAPVCPAGFLWNQRTCMRVSDGRQLDLARWAGVLVAAGTPANREFCVRFRQARLDMDLRAPRIARFALHLLVPGNDLSRLTLEARASAFEDQAALDSVVALYTDALKGLGQISSLTELPMETACTLPATDLPTPLESTSDDP